MAYPALIKLEGSALTDQGRTYTSEREERIVDHELASGKIVKYIKAVKWNWTISWQWLPKLAAETFDNNQARDFIKGEADDGKIKTLEVVWSDSSSDTFAVFIQGYNEEIQRRDYVSDTIFYNVDLELKEQ